MFIKYKIILMYKANVNKTRDLYKIYKICIDPSMLIIKNIKNREGHSFSRPLYSLDHIIESHIL